MPRLPLALAAAAAFPLAAPADDWPQWLGPARDGVWRETGLVDKFPAGGPPVVWEAPVGQGYAGPAVAAGRVFVTDRTLAPGAATPKNPFDKETEVKGGERVLCMDAGTGKVVWEHSYPCHYKISYAAGPRCTPTVDGDKVFTLGAMGDLLCLDAGTGKAVWAKQCLKDFNSSLPVWGFSAPPLVDGDNLVCLVGGTPGRLVVALDKATGAERWRALDFGQGDWGYAPPVILTLAGNRTLVIWHPLAVVGLDPATGAKLWEVPFAVKAALTAPTPRQVGDDGVFVTSFYNGAMLLRVAADGAKVVWKSKAKGERPDQTPDLSSIMPTPLVKGGHVYGVSSYGELRCVEAATGKLVWQSMQATRGPLTPEAVRGRDEPSTAQPWNERWANAFLVGNGDREVLFNEQGELILARLTPGGYDEIDRAQILKPTNRLSVRPLVVWTHPAFANRCVYARNDEKLVCVSLAK